MISRMLGGGGVGGGVAYLELQYRKNYGESVPLFQLS
jgi:hypothetical protein